MTRTRALGEGKNFQLRMGILTQHLKIKMVDMGHLPALLKLAQALPLGLKFS